MIASRAFSRKALSKVAGGEGGHSYIFLMYKSDNPMPTKEFLETQLHPTAGLYDSQQARTALESNGAQLLLSGVWNESQAQAEFLNDSFMRLPVENSDNTLTYHAEGAGKFAVVLSVSANVTDINTATPVHSMYVGGVGDISSGEPFELMTTLVEAIREHSLTNFEVTFRN